MTDIEYIASKLSREDILCQLADEAAELSQAALKLRRAITGTNPAPVDFDTAYDNLLEEIADVEGAVKVLTLDRKKEEIAKISSDKITRWAQRLKAIEGTNTNCEPVTPTDTPTAGVKTRQEKFLEMFPRAYVFNGALNICPGDIDTRQKCHGPKDCRDCRRGYWLTAEKEDSHD